MLVIRSSTNCPSKTCPSLNVNLPCDSHHHHGYKRNLFHCTSWRCHVSTVPSHVSYCSSTRLHRRHLQRRKTFRVRASGRGQNPPCNDYSGNTGKCLSSSGSRHVFPVHAVGAVPAGTSNKLVRVYISKLVFLSLCLVCDFCRLVDINV